MRHAFSYARFSTSEQRDGRSLKRQEEAARAYCQRHDLKLDQQSFTDLGVSAYHGANATHGDLGRFLELVQDGRIPKGSVLVVENSDRLTRLPPDEATAVIMAIVSAGVDVATISPEALYTATTIHQPSTWIPLQVAFCLAHEESRKKAERLADAWEAKRDTAGKIKLTKHGPAWLQLTQDRTGWVVLEDKARWVRRIFALALEGCGVNRISEVLHRECPQGLTGKGWQPSYIRCLLRSRSVLGEYQPHKGTGAKKGRKSSRQACGEPVKNYFPAVIDEDDFYCVERALEVRRRGGGKIRGVPNLFNGLLTNAIDQYPMTMNACNGVKVLVSSGAIRKVSGSVFRSIRYDIFEAAVLSRLAELKPADVLGRPGEAKDRVAESKKKETALKQKIERVTAYAAAAADETVYLDLLARLHRDLKTRTRDREREEAAAATRREDDLGEVQDLVKMLDDAAPKERERRRRKLHAALGRLVEAVWMVVVPNGRYRLVAFQVWFRNHGSKTHREYLITYRPAVANQAGRTEEKLSVRDFPRRLGLGDFDLRRPADAARVEQLLMDLSVDELER
jgi:DNA invertase Pin-like site-specific DNA recombinase